MAQNKGINSWHLLLLIDLLQMIYARLQKAYFADGWPR